MLFFAPDDEQDKDLDEEDADAASDEDSDEEEEDNEDEGDDLSDLDDDEDSDEDDDSDDGEDDDDKPITRRELREALKGRNNDRNARRRVSSKQRVTKQPSEDSKRLDDLENFKRQTEIANKKLDFATEHGLSKKQTNYVFRLTKRPTAKFLEKPHVKAALDAIKSQEGISRNTPSGSGKRFKAPGGKKWTELKPEERQENFADRRRSILANKR